MRDVILEIGSCFLSVVFFSAFFYRTGKHHASRLLINDLLTSYKCPVCMGKYGPNISWMEKSIRRRVKQVVFGELEKD